MKKIAFLIATVSMIISCNQTSKENNNSEESVKQTEQSTTNNQENNIETTNFDIEKLSVSTADLGTFPYFSFPEGLKSLNKPIERKFDAIYFPIDGIMTSREDKIFKANVSVEDRKSDDWSLAFFLKSYNDAILAAGGHKIFDGKITKDEYERYHKNATYLGEDASIGYAEENIKVYVIRKEDGKNIYIQLSGDSAGGKLNILQEEGFKQTIKKITADDIVRDLTEKGKSILYINFDVDKSNITADGKDVVNQIAEALKKDNTVKIAIEGHTDNTGDGMHNKKLSNDRANAVLNALVAQNIDKTRLSAKSFGAERPLVANDSEDNKAKNRRVELIKTN